MSTTVADDLATLPALYDACGIVLGERQRGPGDRVRGGLPRGLHLHEGAFNARSRMLAVLASWSGLLASEEGVPGPSRREVTTLAAFLRTHVDTLAAHPAAEDFAAEIREIADEARRVTCLDSVVRLNLGTCSHGHCGRSVWATRHAGVRVRVRCEAGHDWPAHRWLLLGGAR